MTKQRQINKAQKVSKTDELVLNKVTSENYRSPHAKWYKNRRNPVTLF